MVKENLISIKEDGTSIIKLILIKGIYLINLYIYIILTLYINWKKI